MEKRTSLLFGITLIILAVLALAGNLLMRFAGDIFQHGAQAWPLVVVGAGLLFCLPPFIFFKQRGLSGLFIPGVPVLTTGILLYIANATGHWNLWTTMWPLEVIGLAIGFVLLGIFLRIIWLAIPASIIGVTGLILLFCSLTGAWSSWAALWTLEVLAVGLPLLVIGLLNHMEGVKMAGIILCSGAVVGFTAMSTLLHTTSALINLIGPVLVFGLGIFLVVLAFFKRPATGDQYSVKNPEN